MSIPETIKHKFDRLYKLPAVPETGQQILALQSQPEADFKLLARIIESDPGLTAVVLRFARSPLYGYQGNIDTIEKAISRVLGFDTVVNIAIAISIGSALKIDRHGPLGLDQFWRHSIYTASLTQQLAKIATIEGCPPPGQLYLAGLLHNIGVLILGHMFKPEFAMLNKLAIANPRLPLTQLESHLLCLGGAKDIIGLGHARLGHYLMECWNMPEIVITAVKEHHNYSYDGKYKHLIQLIQLSNTLLKQEGIGDEAHDNDVEMLLVDLQLEMDAVLEVKERLFTDGTEDLNGIANQMAA